MADDRRLQDQERFAAIFREHASAVRRFARRRVGDDAADEIVAETFLVAWRRIDRLPDQVLPWLYRAAYLEIANHRRRQQKGDRIDAALLLNYQAEGSDDDPGIGSEDRSAVTRAFARLSPKDQEILRLAAWEQVSSTEGARIIGCSVASYRVRLHRARARLARRSDVSEPETPTHADPGPRSARRSTPPRPSTEQPQVMP
jgi:RNA polymerase sigma-70 factor, ECF subfamily